MAGGGMEGGGLYCTVRNTDPFPRWPFWTISLPTAAPQDRNIPHVSLSPTLHLTGPAPRIYILTMTSFTSLKRCIQSSSMLMWQVKSGHMRLKLVHNLSLPVSVSISEFPFGFLPEPKRSRCQTQSYLEGSIHQGRGMLDTAHSRRMGVISLALPGLSSGGPVQVGEKKEGEE